MERTIPNPKKCMTMRTLGTKHFPSEGEPVIASTEKTYPVYKTKSEFSVERYLKSIEEFERKSEKKLIEIFSHVDISASVKTDPYSLPYKEEIVMTLNGESYMNGPFEVKRVARKILKELLDKNVYALRFYLLVNCQEGNFGFGKVEYRFRYYPK